MTNKLIPNLFIIGAMKSGTTSLHNYLNEHPQIFMCRRPKEPCYFIHDSHPNKSEDWYLSLFESAGKAHVIGESSTDYSKLPRYQGVPQRILKFNPNAKIIYIMRDPIERSISHYWWEVQWSAEGRDMLTAIKKTRDIIDVSYYAMQLQPYLDIFGRDKVFTLTLEELNCSPHKVLPRIFDWLGVDATLAQFDFNRRDNQSSEKVKRLFGASLLSNLRGTPLWGTIKRIVPTTLRQRAIKSLSRPVDRDTSNLDKTIEYLRPIQQQQTAELSHLLNRQFPEWETLHAGTAQVRSSVS